MSPMKKNRLNTILDVVTRLLIDKPNASMNEIADSADIGVVTLHRYVETREKLMVHLAIRAIEVVGATIHENSLTENNADRYFPKLIEALIPLGDKIYFLGKDASVYSNPYVKEADQKLREPVLDTVLILQEKGGLRSKDKNMVPFKSLF